MALALILALLTGSAATDQFAPAATMTLWVRDDSQVPFVLLSRARAQVAQIYRNAGVRIVWQNSGRVHNADSIQGIRFIVDILSPERAQRLPLPPTCEVLGVAASDEMSRGQVAYVRYGCVKRLAQAGGLDLERALAVVMAHEVGHLLLPYHSHTATGLMRADWSREDLYLAQRELLLFSEDQSRLIRRRIVGSASN